MPLPRDIDSVYILAVERFKQGNCPCCGKGFGQPRGLEYRKGPDNIYCHSCKETWPMELDVEALRAKLAQWESSAPNVDYVPDDFRSGDDATADYASSETMTGDRWGVVTRLSRFLHRIVSR